jgi:acetate kinase
MSNVLTLNAGSSSLKFSIFSFINQVPQALVRGQFEDIGGHTKFEAQLSHQEEQIFDSAASNHNEAIQSLMSWLTHTLPHVTVSAVSHRVVHGGTDRIQPVEINNTILDELSKLTSLAPLHQPHNLSGIHAAQQFLPDVPQIACFDTAFHRTHSKINDLFALPIRFYERGIRRYGFHGLSYEYVSQLLADQFPDLHSKRVIIAHLGNGASMCALRDGRSVASTMGFTALDGLPMGTRCGNLDPGALLYLLTQEKMDSAALTKMLYSESGLKGLSGGLSNDVRTLLADGGAQARLALGYFAEHCRRAIGGLAASIGGLDVLIFTGGIGQHAATVRMDILHDMAWLGIHIDPTANQNNDLVISQANSPTTILVLPTDEEQMLARHAYPFIHH